MRNKECVCKEPGNPIEAMALWKRSASLNHLNPISIYMSDRDLEESVHIMSIYDTAI